MGKFIKYFLFIFLSIIILLLVWGVLIEPRLIDEEEQTASIPGLPAAWEGKRVALIADLQIGMWLDNDWTVSRIIENIAEERPAAVFIAGDFIYHPTDDDNPKEARQEAEKDRGNIAKEVSEVVSLLRPLTEARIPVYAVLGNHDFAMEYPTSVKLEWVAEEVAQTLRFHGVIVLNNEAVPLQMNEGGSNTNAGGDLPLYIVGIGSVYANNSNPSAALGGVPANAPRVVIMHNPDSFPQIPANAAPLALAGHTHGGQIRVPGFPEWSWMGTATKSKVTADGWIDGYGATGNQLYVNRGIGFSLFPIRINCPPELTWFTLKSAPVKNN